MITNTHVRPRRRPRRRRSGSSKAVSHERDARLYRAARSIARGRLERALHGYLRLLADDPEDLPMLNRTADLLIRNGQIARGLEMLARVARGYEEAGFLRKSAAVYHKVLRLAPGSREARSRLVDLYRTRGLRAEARAVFSSPRTS